MDAVKLQRNIMRRVYYSFAISIVAHPMFWRGAFLSVAAVLLARWLHVASIIHNFLAIPVGSTPGYVAGSFMSAATHGELLTVVMVVLSSIVGLSCVWRLSNALFVHRVELVHAH